MATSVTTECPLGYACCLFIYLYVYMSISEFVIFLLQGIYNRTAGHYSVFSISLMCNYVHIRSHKGGKNKSQNGSLN